MAPAHVRERPQWISDLLDIVKVDFPRKDHFAGVKIKAGALRGSGFSAEIPLGWLNLESMPIPGVWPLKGTATKLLGQAQSRWTPST